MRRRLIATQEFPYMAGALMLRPGDKFTAISVEDARMLVGFGKAVEDIDLGATLGPDSGGALELPHPAGPGGRGSGPRGRGSRHKREESDDHPRV